MPLAAEQANAARSPSKFDGVTDERVELRSISITPGTQIIARPLGLVSRLGDGRAVLLVGRDRTGDQCGHQRDDAEQACSGEKWSAFHVTLKPLFMP